jgi:hypothetical protein
MCGEAAARRAPSRRQQRIRALVRRPRRKWHVLHLRRAHAAVTSPIRRLLRELPPHRRGLGGGGGPPGAWDTSNSSPPAPPPSSVVSSVPGPPARVPTYPRHRRGAAPSRGSTDVTNAAARRGAPLASPASPALPAAPGARGKRFAPRTSAGSASAAAEPGGGTSAYSCCFTPPDVRSRAMVSCPM